MGPITILVRRPSLRLPVVKGDLEEEVGAIQSVGRVSAYHSDSEIGTAPQGDPPHWAIQALAQHLRKTYNLTLFNFDLIQPDSTQDHGECLLDSQAFCSNICTPHPPTPPLCNCFQYIAEGLNQECSQIALTSFLVQ